MASLKFTNQDHWSTLEAHMSEGIHERFAFAHTKILSDTGSGPLLEVVGIELIDDVEVESDGTGWQLADTALDRIHNAAVGGGYGLVEFHNHQLGPPGFSRVDEAGLGHMAEYVTSLMPDRPYGAGVYADGRVHVEYWARGDDGIRRERFRSVTVGGSHLRLVNAREAPRSRRLVRQADLLGAAGNATLAGLRTAVIGAGGTGSHAALALAYLGIGEVLILDSDHVDSTNLNRLVSAGQADIGAPKNLVARRRMREIDSGLHFTAMPALTADGDHPELDDVDLIVGCVDHDGPRDRLNQLAVETATPYLDIATGVDTNTTTPIIGGRVVLVAPGGPCLHCLGELDANEVGRWVKDPAQQALDRDHGYGVADPNPAVVHLNGVTVHAAIAELMAWVSGHRSPAQYLDIDLSGFLALADSPPGCRISPRRPIQPRQSCFCCGRANQARRCW